MLDSDGV